MCYFNLYIVIANRICRKIWKSRKWCFSRSGSNNVTLATNKCRASSFELRVDWRRTINKSGAIKICAYSAVEFSHFPARRQRLVHSIIGREKGIRAAAAAILFASRNRSALRRDSYILFARNLSLHVFPFYSTGVLLARVSISLIARPYQPYR